MKTEEAQEFEKKLISRGYKRWDSALYGKEDYDVSKSIRDSEGEHLYQIIYKFWDWTKYPYRHTEMSIDVVIMPRIDGRADLELSSLSEDNVMDIDWVEETAKDFHKFITQRIIDPLVKMQLYHDRQMNEMEKHLD